jgi:hypothetical protein
MKDQSRNENELTELNKYKRRASVGNAVSFMIEKQRKRVTSKASQSQFMNVPSLKFQQIDKPIFTNKDEEPLGTEVISNMQMMLKNCSDNIKQTEKYIELNNSSFAEKPIRKSNKIQFFDRPMRAIKNSDSISNYPLPNIDKNFTNQAIFEKDSMKSSEKVVGFANIFKFELIYDGYLVSINNFVTGQRYTRVSVSGFLERVETIYNNFCEKEDIVAFSEIFKSLVNLEKNPCKSLIERIFFTGRKCLRKKLTNPYLNSLLSNQTILKVQDAYKIAKKDNNGILCGLAPIDSGKVCYRRRDSRFESSFQKQKSFLNGSNSGNTNYISRKRLGSLKPPEFNLNLAADTEVLQVLYYVLTKLTNYTYKSSFSRIDKIDGEISLSEDKLKDLSVLKAQSDIYLSKNQTIRFSQICEKIVNMQKENIHDFTSHCINKSLLKYNYNGTDNGYSYLKNLKKFLLKI